MTRLLAIDPGTRCTGWAMYTDTRLVRCGALRAKSLEEMIATLRATWTWGGVWLSEGGMQIVIERPQVYRQAKQIGDPNDLIDVAFVAGAAAALFEGARLHFVLPSEWKAGVPKPPRVGEPYIIERRLRATLAKPELEALERGLAGLPAGRRYDVIDAAGLGLVAVKRLSRGLV